jgi:hypothetical protein
MRWMADSIARPVRVYTYTLSFLHIASPVHLQKLYKVMMDTEPEVSQ